MRTAALLAALFAAASLLVADAMVRGASERVEAATSASGATTAGDLSLLRTGPGLRVLPSAFVPNLGQWPEATRFVARRGPISVHAFAGSFGVVLAKMDETPPDRADAGVPSLPGARAPRVDATAIRFWFDSSNGAARPEGREPLPTRFHYFLGADSARWREGVAGYRRLCYPDLYDGVDLVLHGGGDHFEYDLHLAPGADLDAVVIRVEGAFAPLRLDADGALVVVSRLGPLRQPVPRAWQETDHGPLPVDCAYEILGPGRFRFRAATARTTSLVIDPQLQYSTYLGGASWDEVFAVARSGGDAVLAGRTFSADFPTQNAFQSRFAGHSDVFVARLPLSGGSLVYSTFLGGSSEDEARALALDASGAPVLAGATGSSDFPLQNAIQTRHAGYLDGFVAHLTPSGGRLLYSTYFGASGVDAAVGLALDGGGAAVLAGGTSSPDLPTQNAFQPIHAGGFDAFVATLPLSGAPPSHATYLGGNQDDGAVAVALDGSGAPVVAGWTRSGDFPTRNAFQPMHGGGYDAFAARLPRSPAPPSCSTYLGGTRDDLAYVVAVDGSGVAVLAGSTSSSDFPTRSAFQANLAGPSDAFVARLPLSGAPPVVSTYLGGTATEAVLALALDLRGEAVVSGWTFSTDFPMQDALQPGHGGFADGFVTRLPPSGGPPTYSTYLGGTDLDKPYAVTVDPSRAALVVGLTASPNFPTRNPLQARLAGFYDVFVTRLDLLPPGLSSYGASTPGCAGPLPIGASASPRAGSATFACTCEHAPASSTGLLGLSSRGLSTPVVVQGASVWIDPTAPVFALVFASSTASGAARVPIPIPPDAGLAAAQAFAQFYWADACAVGGISASNALQVTVQR